MVKKTILIIFALLSINIAFAMGPAPITIYGSSNFEFNEIKAEINNIETSIFKSINTNTEIYYLLTITVNDSLNQVPIRLTFSKNKEIHEEFLNASPWQEIRLDINKKNNQIISSKKPSSVSRPNSVENEVLIQDAIYQIEHSDIQIITNSTNQTQIRFIPKKETKNSQNISLSMKKSYSSLSIILILTLATFFITFILWQSHSKKPKRE